MQVSEVILTPEQMLMLFGVLSTEEEIRRAEFLAQFNERNETALIVRFPGAQFRPVEQKGETA